MAYGNGDILDCCEQTFTFKSRIKKIRMSLFLPPLPFLQASV
jgi:hypothetical protein